jgi:hypothetical protein
MEKEIKKLEKGKADFEEYLKLIIFLEDVELLTELSTHKNAFVRAAVAQNDNTERDVIEEFTLDESFFVRSMVHHHFTNYILRDMLEQVED